MTLDAVDEQRMIHVLGREIPRELFFARLFYLLYFASFGSLFPLLAVYFKQLGMTAAQAGMLLGCRSLVEFVACPFWGSFADRFKKGCFENWDDIILIFDYLSVKFFEIYAFFDGYEVFV